MNFGELRSMVRASLAEGGGGVYTDAVINATLNASQRTLSANYNLLRKVTSVTFTGEKFTLPADFGGFVDAPTLDNGVALAKTNPMDVKLWDADAFTPTSTTGSPSVYADLLFDLGQTGVAFVYPRPTGSTRVTFSYYAVPAAMSADSDTPWNARHADFHDLIALHAAAQLLGRGGVGAAANTTFLQRLELRRQEFSGALSGAALEGAYLAGYPARPSRRR